MKKYHHLEGGVPSMHRRKPNPAYVDCVLSAEKENGCDKLLSRFDDAWTLARKMSQRRRLLG